MENIITYKGRFQTKIIRIWKIILVICKYGRRKTFVASAFHICIPYICIVNVYLKRQSCSDKEIDKNIFQIYIFDLTWYEGSCQLWFLHSCLGGNCDVSCTQVARTPSMNIFLIKMLGSFVKGAKKSVILGWLKRLYLGLLIDCVIKYLNSHFSPFL